jgi:hypothetical protein
MKRHLIVSAAAAALMLSACSSIGTAPAGPMKVGGGHTVTLGRSWADISAILPQRQNNVRVLSIDGPMLNRLYLAQGLEDGQGLIKAKSKEKRVPTYRKDMSPTELVEFTADTVAALGYQRVETEKPRPATFGTLDALRLDIKAMTDSGLEIAGTAQLARQGDKLYVVLYLAPAEHYFAATLPEVESLLKSAV